MDWTGATTVLRKMTWLHEVMCTTVWKLASYQDTSITQFVHGYLLLMEGEEMAIKERMASLLKDLMSDAELYGWDQSLPWCLAKSVGAG